MGLKDFQDAMKQHGIAIVFTAGIVGIGVGGTVYSGMKDRAEWAEKMVSQWKDTADRFEKRAGEFEKRSSDMTTELARSRERVAALEPEAKRLDDEVKSLQTSLAKTSGDLVASNRTVDQLRSDLAKLTTKKPPPSTPAPPPSPPPASANPVVERLYKNGIMSIRALAIDLKAAQGFVETQILALERARIVEEWTTGYKLTTAGRSYAERNGLDRPASE